MLPAELYRTFAQVGGNTFPFCNIHQSDDGYTIEVALAGYNKSEIKVYLEDSRTLVISADSAKELEFTGYIFKGITSRAFAKKFSIDPNMVVGDITFENGLLQIPITVLADEPTRVEFKIN